MDDEKKALTMRIPMPVWRFLKKKAIDKETTLTKLVIEQLNKYKNRCEKGLTERDT